MRARLPTTKRRRQCHSFSSRVGAHRLDGCRICHLSQAAERVRFSLYKGLDMLLLCQPFQFGVKSRGVEGARCSRAGSARREDEEMAHIWGILVYARHKDVSDSRAGLASSFSALTNSKSFQGLAHLRQKVCLAISRSSAKGCEQ